MTLTVNPTNPTIGVDNSNIPHGSAIMNRSRWMSLEVYWNQNKPTDNQNVERFLQFMRLQDMLYRFDEDRETEG